MAAILHVNTGQRFRIDATIKVGETLTDPTSVTVTVDPPNVAPESPVAATKDGVGLYSYERVPATPGYYILRFAGDAPAESAAEVTVYVRPSGIGG